MYYIAILTILLMINSLIIMAETSLFSSSRTKLHGKTLLLYLKSISGKVAIFIVILDFMLQQYISYVLLYKIQQSVVLVSTLYTIIGVFCHLLSKNIALMNPEYTYSVLGYGLYICYYLFSPVILIVYYIINNLLYLFDISAKPDTVMSYIEEIRSILLSANSFEKSNTELQLVENIFDLRNTMVNSIMIPRNRFCKIQYSINMELNIKNLLNNSQHLFIVVEKDDAIIGYINFYNFLKDLRNNKLKPSFDSYIIEPVFIMESLSVFRVIQDSKNSGNKIYFVIDEYGIVLGLVTMKDLFDELICAPYDEDLHIKKTKDGFMINGLQNIRLLNKYLQWTLPEQFLTISGLLINKFKRIPKPQETVTINNISFIVTEVGYGKITSVMATHNKESYTNEK